MDHTVVCGCEHLLAKGLNCRLLGIHALVYTTGIRRGFSEITVFLAFVVAGTVEALLGISGLSAVTTDDTFLHVFLHAALRGLLCVPTPVYQGLN